MTTPMTKERLEELAAGQSGFNLRIATHEESQEMARMLLAGMEQEPVAYMIGGHYLMHAQDPKVDNYSSAVPLYAAPQPAPVVHEWTNEECMAFLSIAFRHAEIKGDLALDDIRMGVKMVNGSRAAMLNEPRARVESASTQVKGINDEP